MSVQAEIETRRQVPMRKPRRPIVLRLEPTPAYEWRQAFGKTFKRSDAPTIRTILRTVCDYYEVSMHDILSRRKPLGLVRPRQIAVFLARELTACSYPEMGKVFRRDHTTMLHSVRHVPILMKFSPQVRDDIAKLRSLLERETMEGLCEY